MACPKQSGFRRIYFREDVLALLLFRARILARTTTRAGGSNGSGVCAAHLNYEGLNYERAPGAEIFVCSPAEGYGSITTRYFLCEPLI